MDLDSLAIQAKTDQEAFNTLLYQLQPMCKKFAATYCRWYFPFDDIHSLAQYDIWLAVKNYDPTKRQFFWHAQKTIGSHLRTRIYRELSGLNNSLNKGALRFQALLDGDDYTFDVEEKGSDCDTILQKRESIQNTRILLEQAGLTPLEYNCITLQYYENLSYEEIMVRLGVNWKSVTNALQRAKRKLSKDERLREEYLSLMEVSA